MHEHLLHNRSTLETTNDIMSRVVSVRSSGADCLDITGFYDDFASTSFGQAKS